MNRGVTDRGSGSTVGDRSFVTGKLQYLDRNGLGGISVKHQDDAFGNQNVASPLGGMTSIGKGNRPTADFILSELQAGEDVEMGFTWGTLPFTGNEAGHWVELVGGGRVLGVPFVLYRSDHEQTSTDPMDNKGISPFPDISVLLDTDGDGLLNLVWEKGSPNVDIVVSESVPEPSSFLLLAAGLVALGVIRRKKRPS
jgi:hypothetical protein